MKLPQLPPVVVGCAMAMLLSLTARAFDIPTFDDGNDAPMPAAVVQLYTDLNGIAVGTTPTSAQHEALVADLNALASGIFTPDPTDVDQLATDLGTAATAGLFSDDVLEYLADDFIVDPGDPTPDSDGWMEDIQDDVASLIDPPDDTFAPGDLPTFYAPLDGVVYTLAASSVGKSATRMSVPLVAQGIPPFLLENYTGRAQLATHTVAGRASVATLRVHTEGLPLVNPYTVSITRRSDGASVTVGKLHVRNGFNGILTPILAEAATPLAELLSYGRAVFGGDNAKKPLPAGFDASDVATVTVTDAQGVVRLTGSLSAEATSSQVQTLNVHLSGPTAAPATAPYANVAIRHKVTPTATSDHFRLLAHHLPANAVMTFSADGAVVGQYTTTAHGRLFLVEGFVPPTLSGHRAPVFEILLPGTDLSGAKTFTLTDAQGATVLSGSLN